MAIIKNGDLLQAKKSKWRDKLFIVTREPIFLKDKDEYEIFEAEWATRVFFYNLEEVREQCRPLDIVERFDEQIILNQIASVYRAAGLQLP